MSQKYWPYQQMRAGSDSVSINDQYSNSKEMVWSIKDERSEWGQSIQLSAAINHYHLPTIDITALDRNTNELLSQVDATYFHQQNVDLITTTSQTWRSWFMCS